MSLAGCAGGGHTALLGGVELVLLTRHTDCAAEKAARSPELRARFPHLVLGVDERAETVRSFLQRPFIAEKIAREQLVVRELVIDTKTEQFIDAR